MATQTADLAVESAAEAQPAQALVYATPKPRIVSPLSPRAIGTAIAMPLATAVALLVHYFVPNN